MDSRAIINIIDSLDSTSVTDGLSANQGRVLNEKIKAFNIIRDITGLNLNEQIGEIIIAYGNDCINKPIGVGNGYLINLPHATASNTYNKQFWIVRVDSRIYTRRMENGVWSTWEKIVG